ncbi:MAG: sodium:proton antiporter [Alphaproteobacteria bacterium]|nr:MAG: sodium:proton antiporter [Alphaproteobacteria bacterium]
MEVFVVGVFVLGYLAITLEHPLKIDKLGPALIMMALTWAGIALAMGEVTGWLDFSTNAMVPDFAELGHETKLDILEATLLHHFGEICEILVFLLGAMTIVEIIDQFQGFSTIHKIVKTTSKRKLLWIMAALAFMLSAIIDNLTATIVLITLLRKLIDSRHDRLWFAGLIIIAANAGGAWSPIGDVTTTMLWVGDKVTTSKLIFNLFLPSLICMVVPTVVASYLPAFRGSFKPTGHKEQEGARGMVMLVLGLGMIIFVPIFKTVTHLPPYVGMMFSLAVVSLAAEFFSHQKCRMPSNPTHKAMGRIELPSILFFLGILMTVSALESLGLILDFGQTVRAVVPDTVFILLLGIASAVIDNIPLVAASMGMFDVGTDDGIWHFIAYTAGTGGSMLIIGSAAGVVAMGMERISFGWYLKNISLLALTGYGSGSLTYLALTQLTTGL